jgi:hypothetical protein
MADVQALFEQFHKNIRTYYEINETLRTKKDIIVNRVKAHLEKNNRPTCHVFLQGSYKMKVGTCALPGTEFDIDVGLRFEIDESDYTTKAVREWVFEAVDGHTETVIQKPNCIRVVYKDGFHVDLVAYAWWENFWGNEEYRLAHETKGWRPADPPKLVSHVAAARKPFSDSKDTLTQTDQFRRVVRYLKRWNDEAIRGESRDKPSGIALVLLTEQHLSNPATTWSGANDDRAAVARIANAAANTWGRITAYKPTPENEDLFAGLSDDAMNTLKARFSILNETLKFAEKASDTKDACKELKKVFGSDFPCPSSDDERTESARRTSAPAIIPSSSSGA